LPFTGSAEVQLNATCNVSNPALCAQIDNAIAVEESELQAEADTFDYWPVLSLGVSYRF
jgi:dimeric dUTPase (all-alpha-NTP-PPase superfamily)